MSIENALYKFITITSKSKKVAHEAILMFLPHFDVMNVK